MVSVSIKLIFKLMVLLFALPLLLAYTFLPLHLLALLAMLIFGFLHFVHDIYQNKESSVFEHWILHETDLLSKPIRWREHNLILRLLCLLLLLVKERPHIVDKICHAEQHNLQASITLLFVFVVRMTFAQRICEGVQAMLVDLEFGFERVVRLAHGGEGWTTGLCQVVHALVIE